MAKRSGAIGKSDSLSQRPESATQKMLFSQNNNYQENGTITIATICPYHIPREKRKLPNKRRRFSISICLHWLYSQRFGIQTNNNQWDA